MSTLAAYAEKALNFVTYYFDKMSAPNPKYFPDKVLYDTEHNRYKSLVLIQWLAFVGFIMNLLTSNGEPGPNIQGLMGTSFMSGMFFLTNHFRLHPQIIKVTYNLYVLFFAPLLIRNGEHGILGACLAVPMFPILVYLVTGGIGHFFFHLVCQTLFMSTFYQDFLRRGFAYMSVDETVQAMTYYVHQNLQYTFIFTGIIHYTIHTASYKIRIAEKKKDDFEKQKNFLLGFSHELRNLINSLMGNVKLAFLENPSEKVKDLLVNAEVCGELLLHLVNNILDTGKVEIGELEINPAPRKVYDTLERIWSVCSELIKRKNLRGIFKIQKDIPEMLVFDHYRITQILMNLVGNAVKYTDLGHINIIIEWISDKETVTEDCFKPYPFNDTDDQEEGIFEKNQALSIFDSRFIIMNFGCRQIDRNKIAARTGDAKKGILKISITDSGCGILQEDLIKIFERFTQGVTDPSKSKLGTGLGLFITKELCHRMNGEIKVFTKRNFGSAFIVCIPLEPVPTERAFFFDLEGIQRVIVEQQKIRAMIVDDEQLSQMILRDFLSKLNVEVLNVAENGLKACEKFEQIADRKDFINIVTMDLTMPVMDGKTAAQRIREIERARNLEPCLMIIISGNCTESEIQECLDKNGRIRADAFVKKPVSLDELCRIISSHFAHLYNKQRVRLLAE